MPREPTTSSECLRLSYSPVVKDLTTHAHFISLHKKPKQWGLENMWAAENTEVPEDGAPERAWSIPNPSSSLAAGSSSIWLFQSYLGDKPAI